MGLFDWLFGRTKPQLTPFGEFLTKITIQKIPAVSEQYPPDMKVPMAVALSALNSAHFFWREFSDSVRQLKFSDKTEVPHDIFAFEAAAYANYYFLKDADQDKHVGDDDDDGPTDPYKEAVLMGVTATYKVMEPYLKFEMSLDTYANRVVGYGMPRTDLPIPRPATDHEILVDFERLIISSMKRGYPAKKTDWDLADLGVEALIKPLVQGYHFIILAGATQSIRNYHRFITTGQLPPPK